MKRRTIAGLSAGLALVLGLAVIRHLRVQQRRDAPLASPPPTAVETAPVTAGTLVRSRHVLGVVLGGEETDVAPQVMARVVAIAVREGDAVHAGQLLARLDDREARDALVEAKAARAAAEVAEGAQRAATARDRRLFEVKAIAQEQWDRSQAAGAAAQAQLAAATQRVAQARTRLGYCEITAPADGTIARRLADPGDLGVPGKPLLKLVRQQTVRVRGALPAEDFTALHPGLAVRLSTADQVVPATVTRVFPTLGETHLATIECDLASPPPGFVSGTPVGMDVELSSVAGLTVPADALLEGDTGAWVFVVHDGNVSAVRVQVLNRSTDRIAVSGAVRPGQSVVVAQPARLLALAARVTAAPGDSPALATTRP